MGTATTETTTETTQTEVMNKLYRSLTIAQANVILYLRKAADREDLIRRATEMTDKLDEFIAANEEPEGNKCEEGKVWNPATQQCE